MDVYCKNPMEHAHELCGQNAEMLLLNLAIYRMIQKDGPNFVRLYFLNYTWYVNDLHNI